MLPAKALFRSTLWKKTMVAVTGLALFGFLVTHVAGNLKVFQGEEKFNHYAEFLREIGAPVFPHEGVLWIARLVLLAAAGIHVTYALQLAAASREARGSDYQHELKAHGDKGSRYMVITGGLLGAFIVFHILHFTTGHLHHDFQPGEAYANLVTAFQGWRFWIVGLIYLGAMGVLAVHLKHGLWSLFQTLGWNHPRYNPMRLKFAIGAAVLIAGAFALVPLAAFVGAIG